MPLCKIKDTVKVSRHRAENFEYSIIIIKRKAWSKDDMEQITIRFDKMLFELSDSLGEHQVQ